MELSRIERLILANQYRIVEKVNSGNAAAHRQNAEMHESGYSGQCSTASGASNEEISDQERNRVIDLWNMYRALQNTCGDVRERKAG